ncbi:hypothetical protein [Legionella nagasakiensis]|uniref:hypothetical protein n=1 Tax=Legionella nagasakiensis TaxID=535290 RepID=UPI00105586E9|nr:hypothetical protein [Legionella nagasakiensis]
MALIKSSLDGIGTGAGVAWPFFGIFTSSLGIAAGSTLALVTGSIAGLLFCVISGAIFYWSYQHTQNKKTTLQLKLFNHQKKLNTLLSLYLEDGYHDCLYRHGETDKPIEKEAIIAYLKTKIAKDLKDSHGQPPTASLFSALLNHEASKDLFEQFVLSKRMPSANMKKKMDDRIYALTSKLLRQVSIKPIPKTILLRSAFMGAAGAFGAVAGCTAGFVGLLSGLGLITGFSAIPIIGWATLAVAIGLAILVAVNTASHITERQRIKEMHSNAKCLCQDLQQRHTNREIKIKAMDYAREIINQAGTEERPVGFPFFKPSVHMTQERDTSLSPYPISIP